MFLDNRSNRIYCQIMDRAKTRSIIGYSEKHHIIPRSLGGSNCKSNIAVLTPREHYLAHLLLVRMTTGEARRSMSYALSFFNASCKNHKRSIPKSRWYDLSRKLLSEANKGKQPSDNCRLAVSKSKKGKPLSPQHKSKISNTLSKKHLCYAISPTGEYFQSSDLKLFCEKHGVSFHTVIKRVTPICVITTGSKKGWIISRMPLPNNALQIRNDMLANTSAKKSDAITKAWSNRVG